MNKIKDYITPKAIVILYMLVCVTSTLIKYYHKGRPHNNYIMFTEPVNFMLRGETIYAAEQPEYTWDTYKYSPTFAFLMGGFHLLPDVLGLLIWNSINTLILIAGIYYFFKDEADYKRKFLLVLPLLFFDSLTSTQNCQSNNMIAGIILLGYYLLRTEKPFWASLMFVICMFIKFYGVGAAIVFFLFPNKSRFIFGLIFWSLVFLFLPLLIIPWEQLFSEYIKWFSVMNESKTRVQLSIMGVLQKWFGVENPFGITEIIGLTIFLSPLIFYRKYPKKVFQDLILSSFLVFVIVFNKMAESPTYIIAMTGVAIWFFQKEKIEKIDLVLLIAAIFFCSLSPTDIIPKLIRKEFLVPYKFKAVAIFLVWLKIQYDLWMLINQKKLTT